MPFLSLIKIINLKLLILKDRNQDFASNIKWNWAIHFFYLMITGQNQNLAMIPCKTLGNVDDKNFSSRLADFGH